MITSELAICGNRQVLSVSWDGSLVSPRSSQSALFNRVGSILQRFPAVGILIEPCEKNKNHEILDKIGFSKVSK